MISSVRVWVSRLAAIVLGTRRDAELRDEVAAHLEHLADDYQRRGMSERDALTAARRDFGGVDQMKETYRDQRGLRLLEDAAQDARYALRGFRKSRGFVAAVVLSLGLGIGVASTVFAVVNTLMLNALPVRNPQELFVVIPQLVGAPAGAPAVPARFSYPAFESFRRATPQSGSLAAMSRVARMTRRDNGGDFQETAVQLVSGEYFSTLGVSPAQGRLLGPDDNRTVGGHAVAVISHGLWSRSFDSDPSIVGRAIIVNGQSLTIVGVAAQGFSGVWLESPVDLWAPLMMQHEVRYQQNYSASDVDASRPWVPEQNVRWLDLVGRAPDGLSEAGGALTAEYLKELIREAERVPEGPVRARLLRQRVVLQPFGLGFSNLRTQFAPPLVALFGLALLVLLIACANAANLLLARAAVRGREIAVRLSIGASRGRLVRQLLTESAMLSAAACVAGLWVAGWAANLLMSRATAAPASVAADINGRVIAFALASAVLTVLVAGLVPAFQTTMHGGRLALRTPSAGGGGRPGLQKMLVAAQVALSLVLVVAAGLFAQTLRNYSRVSLGYSRDHVLSVSIDLRAARYQGSLDALSRALIERVESIPGVISASTSSCPLATGCRSVSDVVVEGYEPSAGESIRVQEFSVSPNYFATTGMRLLEGREIDASDRSGTRAVAIINRSMARKYFKGASPVGRRFGYDKPDVEIVGVVEDSRVNRVQQEPGPMVFHAMSQQPYPSVVDVRTAGDARALTLAVQRAVSEIVPAVPVRVTVLSEQVASTLNQERLVAGLTSIFGGLALGLASLGLFGVMSYAVAQRTVEFGVRMALGAPRSSVLSSVLRESLGIIGIGLAAGLPAVLALSRATGALLFGISPTDFTTTISGVALLVAVAAAASFAPAWRASRVDPIVALRQE